jgi:hypothetical protein
MFSGMKKGWMQDAKSKRQGVFRDEIIVDRALEWLAGDGDAEPENKKDGGSESVLQVTRFGAQEPGALEGPDSAKVMEVAKHMKDAKKEKLKRMEQEGTVGTDLKTDQDFVGPLAILDFGEAGKLVVKDPSLLPEEMKSKLKWVEGDVKDYIMSAGAQ